MHQWYAQQIRIVLWTPVGFAIGIGLYFAQTVEPSAQFALAVNLATIALFLGAWAFLRSPPYLLLLCVIIALGFGWTKFRSHMVAGPVLEQRVYGAVQGQIVRIDVSHSGKTRLTLRRVTIDGLSKSATPRRVRISLHGPEQRLFHPGDVVMTTAHISPPPAPAEPTGFDFQRFAWFQKLGGVGYSRVRVLLWDDTQTRGIRTRVLAIRHAISDYILTAMPATTGGVLVAITVGLRSGLDPAVVEDLRAANLAHLLAISGLHMGLLTGLVFGFFRYGFVLIPYVALYFDPKKWAAGLALLSASGYLAFSGSSIATERAFIMMCVMLGAVILGRRAITLRAIALAALIVLILRPESLLSPGFQMSFSATIALVVGFGLLAKTNLRSVWPPLRWLVYSIFSALIAGAATAPFAAVHFNMMPHYGVIANVIAVPIMALIVMPAAIATLVLSTIGLDYIGFWVLDLGIGAIIEVAGFVSGLGHSVSNIPTPHPWVMPMFALGAIVTVLWIGWFRIFGVLISICALWAWSQTTRPDILISDTGTLAGVMTEQGRWLSHEKGAAFVAQSWLENDGDPVDQMTAANRLSPLEIQVFRRMPKEGLPCSDALVIVAAFVKDPACDVIDLTYLRQTGSMAGYLGEAGISWHTTRAQTGRRLWNDKDVRKAQLQ